MFAQERQQLICKIVQSRRRMTFSELEDLTKVSPATLRRDLSMLEKAREIIRVHGGVLDPSFARGEASFDERMVQYAAAKKAIAAKAALLVPPDASVLVDAGSTCLEVGKALLERKDIRIITHSVALLQMAFRGEASVVCLGGELRKVSGALTGAGALGALASLHADVAFIGASGLDRREGCSTTELSEAEMKKALLIRCRRRILLADHTKWQNPSTIRFAAWREFTDWVTDQSPGARTARSLGVKIHLS
jgi:DeoR family fructose operon transcriptional repressor